MAVLRKIKDGNTTIYPMTSTLNVFTEDGQNLNDLLFKPTANIQPITFTTYSYQGISGGDEATYHWNTNIPITTDLNTYWDIKFSNPGQITSFIDEMMNHAGSYIDITIGTTNVHLSTGDLFGTGVEIMFTRLQTNNYYLYYTPESPGNPASFDTILKENAQTKKSLQAQIDELYEIINTKS